MKILVVSDTHGHDENLMRVLQREWPIDALIHCGDLEGSEDYIPEAVECPCFFVRGNNDFFSDLPKEEVFSLENYRIMVTHGHMYGVSLAGRRSQESSGTGCNVWTYPLSLPGRRGGSDSFKSGQSFLPAPAGTKTELSCYAN